MHVHWGSFAINVAIAAATAGVTDVVCQGLELSHGNQAENQNRQNADGVFRLFGVRPKWLFGSVVSAHDPPLQRECREEGVQVGQGQHWAGIPARGPPRFTPEDSFWEQGP